jgi:hypothetical protein
MIIALGFGATRGKFSAAAAFGTALLLAWLIFFVAAMPVLLPDRAEQIARTLKSQNHPAKSVLLIGDVRLASRLRVVLGKNWTVVRNDELNPASAKHYPLIVVPEKEIYHFLDSGWKIQPAAAQYEVPEKNELWQALKSRRLPEILGSHEQKTYVAARS